MSDYNIYSPDGEIIGTIRKDRSGCLQGLCVLLIIILCWGMYQTYIERAQHSNWTQVEFACVVFLLPLMLIIVLSQPRSKDRSGCLKALWLLFVIATCWGMYLVYTDRAHHSWMQVEFGLGVFLLLLMLPMMLSRRR